MPSPFPRSQGHDLRPYVSKSIDLIEQTRRPLASVAMDDRRGGVRVTFRIAAHPSPFDLASRSAVDTLLRAITGTPDMLGRHLIEELISGGFFTAYLGTADLSTNAKAVVIAPKDFTPQTTPQAEQLAAARTYADWLGEVALHVPRAQIVFHSAQGETPAYTSTVTHIYTYTQTQYNEATALINDTYPGAPRMEIGTPLPMIAIQGPAHHRTRIRVEQRVI